MILSIAGLASKVWFKCSFGSNEIKLGLKRGSFSGDSGYGYVNFEESMCSDVGKLLLNGDVPCVTGQAALGLGVTAVLLLAAAAAMGALIAFKRQTGGLWGGALSLNIVGGVLALVSGAGYMGRMTDYFNANEFCDAGQSAPILMIISQSTKGERGKSRRGHERGQAGEHWGTLKEEDKSECSCSSFPFCCFIFVI